MFIGHQRLDLGTCTDADLASATFISLTFTDQKNGVRGEVIGLSLSGNLFVCPVRAVCHHIQHVRTYGALLQAPLACVFVSGAWAKITPTHITTTLRTAVSFLGP